MAKLQIINDTKLTPGSPCRTFLVWRGFLSVETAIIYIVFDELYLTAWNSD